MIQSLVAACIQSCATSDAAANLTRLKVLVRAAAGEDARFVALPEACDFLSEDIEEVRDYARCPGDTVALKELSDLAAARAIWLLIGSLTVRDAAGDLRNRSFLVNPKGQVTATYDKIHMFDACVPGMEDARESDIYRPGEDAVVTNIDSVATGMTICYDLRFPHLYRALAKGGAQMLTVPAAFARHTGEAHWHVLLRSRAIENGCFVVAPGQCGNPYGSRFSFGHSLIVDPWGQVLADAGEAEGYVVAELDFREIEVARGKIMSLDHDRQFSLPVNSRNIGVPEEAV